MRVNYNKNNGNYSVTVYGKKEYFPSYGLAKEFIDAVYIQIEQRKARVVLMTEYMPVLHVS